jgi:hypothetical protein
MYLKKLRELVPTKDHEYLFPCVTDLVGNGLKPAELFNEGRAPSRQDVTQFLVSWFKYTGLSANECREWMIEYTTGVLSAISSSSKSQIRHSTKSNIKYIYGSNVTFDCGCENNQFKATCEKSCIVYDKMALQAEEKKKRATEEFEQRRIEYTAAETTAPKRQSVKELYKEQFDKAMVLAQQSLEQKVARKDIVSLLNENGFKTRTGKTWTYKLLTGELKKLNSDKSEA